LQEAIQLGATVINQAAAAGWDPSGVILQNGRTVAARHIVIAAGMGSAALVPGLPLRPRKGHLAITERYPGFVHHQLVELGYLQSAHGNGMESVAFNVQPRPTGQVLIGSSRQFDTEHADVDPPVLARMLERALDYLPGLGTLQILRTWAGFRPALPDNLPALGALYKTGTKTRNVWLATGHEGLGVTTALSSAEILCHLITGSACAMDPAPFSPDRFGLTA
jgi:D-hydroxyproline dehydrogenase subunit beta